MSDEEDGFDPNANVPLWINIVVPIATVVLFAAVLVLLWNTEMEVSTETLKHWISRTPLLNKCITYDLTDRTKGMSTSKEPLLGQDNLANKHSDEGNSDKPGASYYGSLASGSNTVF